MKLNSGLILTILMSLFLAACASKTEQVTPVDPTPVTPEVVDTTPYEYSDLTADQLRALGIYGDPLNEKIVYFEYNSSSIDRRSQVILDAHAKYLSERAGTAVTLEGHADERGTRDYNLALGERRAKAVSKYLSVNLAGSNNKTVSYGEERPVNSDHTESAWRENRRVEVKY